MLGQQIWRFNGECQIYGPGKFPGTVKKRIARKQVAGAPQGPPAPPPPAIAAGGFDIETQITDVDGCTGHP